MGHMAFDALVNDLLPVVNMIELTNILERVLPGC